MAVVIPLILNTPLTYRTGGGAVQTTQIIRVVSLHDPVPAFQFGQDFTNLFGDIAPTTDANLVRNTSPSFGYPHTTDSSGVAGPTDGNYLKPNSYALVQPSRVFPVDQAHPYNDATNSILLIDVSVAPIQPGFSRVRVDYVDAITQTQKIAYFDMPFYEGWDIHPTEVQSIVDYTQGAYDFIQTELHNLDVEVGFIDNHLFLTGTSVSGQVSSTIANQNLFPALPQAHSLPIFETLSTKDIPAVPSSDIAGSISTASPYVYAGQTFVVTPTFTPQAGDTLTINNHTLTTTISGGSFVGTAPSFIPYSVDVKMVIKNKGVVRSNPYTVHFRALPYIASFLTTDGVARGEISDEFVITGSNFTTTQGTVTFSQAVTATILSWSDTSIIGIVPAGASSGAVTVKVNGHTVLTNFSIYNPSVSATYAVTPHLAVYTTSQVNKYQLTYNGAAINANWSIVTPVRNIGSGDLAHGTIAQDGTYTAPAMVTSPLPLSIVANFNSPFGPVTTTASVVIVPASGTLTVSPSASSVAPHYTERFTAYNNGVKITNNFDVEWFVNGIPGGNDDVGTISASGLFQAPIITSTVRATTITAVSQGLSAHAAVRVADATDQAHSMTMKTGIIVPPSLPTIDSVGQACPGQPVTVTGSNWASDAQFFAVGDSTAFTIQNGPISVGNGQYSVSLFIPTGPRYPSNGGPYTIYTNGSTGSSSTTPTSTNQLVFPPSCSVPPPAPNQLVVTGPATVCNGSQAQFTATYNGSNVTNLATWSSNAPAGLYTAGGGTTVTATYQGSTNSATVQSVDCTPPAPPAPSGCDQLLVLPAWPIVMVPGGRQNFVAYLQTNGGTARVTPDYWLVNGVPGGTSKFGTITPTGVYTAPTTSPGYTHVQVTALLHVANGTAGPEDLSGYAVVSLALTQATGPSCNVTVASQINVFFGDGRVGYIPAGGTYQLAPNQYLSAIYTETLDSNFRPIVSSTSQQLAVTTYYAQLDPLTMNQYYVGNLQKNNNGTYTRQNYLVLGVCDPQDGQFHSMWDLQNLVQAIDNDIPPQPPCAHGMFLSESKSITIEDYAKEKLNKHEPVDVSVNLHRPHTMWIGSASYDFGLVNTTNLTLLLWNETTQTYDERATFEADSFTIKTGQYLVALPTSSGTWELQVLSADDNLFNSSRTYVLGTVVGERFVAVDGSLITEPVSKKVSVEELPAAMQEVIKRMKDNK